MVNETGLGAERFPVSPSASPARVLRLRPSVERSAVAFKRLYEKASHTRR